MYDAILISTHYNYERNGMVMPSLHEGDHEDLSMIIPLGVIHIAQYLHDNGFNVRVVHLPHEIHALNCLGANQDYVNNPIEEILQKYPARVCGIQVHWYLYCGGAVFISNAYKKLFPDSKVVLGGHMAAACWKGFLNFSKDIDGIIIGEGEKPFRSLLDKIQKSPECDLRGVTGLAYRDGDDKPVFPPVSQNENLDLDELPIIRPDAAPFANLFWQKRHFINISRGRCPENCAYCMGNNNAINRRSFQTVKIDKILEQIRVYQQSGIRELFLGENQFLNVSFMTELIEKIIHEKFDLSFELETHPVLFEDKKLLEKMIDAKFFRFTMGCESGSDSVLKRMGRKSSTIQILNSVKEIAERGGLVLTSWISNLPGETDLEFRQTQEIMRRVVKAGGLIFWIENLHVFPGTRLFENPEYWNIEIVLTDLQNWIDWSLLSKHYVSYEEALGQPMKYLTHVSRHISPTEMIERFYGNRKLAASLIPEMKSNLAHKFREVPLEIIRSEMQTLDWYEREGWKLWLF